MHLKQNKHCASVYSFIFLINNSHEPTVHDGQWLADQQPMSCKGRARNRFFPHRIYCPGIGPETEQKTTKPLATIVGVPTKRRSRVPPECKSEASFPSVKFPGTSYWLCPGFEPRLLFVWSFYFIYGILLGLSRRPWPT
jgi:hypothetical protein